MATKGTKQAFWEGKVLSPAQMRTFADSALTCMLCTERLPDGSAYNICVKGCTVCLSCLLLHLHNSADALCPFCKTPRIVTLVCQGAANVLDRLQQMTVERSLNSKRAADTRRQIRNKLRYEVARKDVVDKGRVCDAIALEVHDMMWPRVQSMMSFEDVKKGAKGKRVSEIRWSIFTMEMAREEFANLLREETITCPIAAVRTPIPVVPPPTHLFPRPHRHSTCTSTDTHARASSSSS